MSDTRKKWSKMTHCKTKHEMNCKGTFFQFLMKIRDSRKFKEIFQSGFLRKKLVELCRIVGNNAHEYSARDSMTVGILQNVVILNSQYKKDASDVNVQ